MIIVDVKTTVEIEFVIMYVGIPAMRVLIVPGQYVVVV